MANERLNPARGEGGPRHSNPNIFYNWDFTNLINQRGKAAFSTTGNEVWFDGWYLFRGTGETTSAGVSVAWDGKTQTAGGLSQHVEGDWSGKNLTYSVLVDNELLVLSGTAPTVYNSQLYKDFYLGEDIIRLVFQPTQTFAFVTIYMYSENKHTFVAAKLELGPVQTLAHKEGGKWVLNEVPDYGEQLAKCQRYQVVFDNTTKKTVGGGVACTANEIAIPLSGFYMAKNPTLIVEGKYATTDKFSNATKVEPHTIRLHRDTTQNNIVLEILSAESVAQGKFEVGKYYYLMTNSTDAKLIFDANL